MTGRRIRRFQDPTEAALWFCGGLVAAGFVAIALAWRGAADRLDVAGQLPFLVSGGLAGLALIGLAAAVFSVVVGRRLAAEERHQLDSVLDHAADVVLALGDPVPSAVGRADKPSPRRRPATP